MGGKFREGSGESWDREKVGSGRGNGVACGGGEDEGGEEKEEGRRPKKER